MTQPGVGAEFEQMLVSEPFERDDGSIVRSFYHSAVGYGQVEAANDSPANIASVTFYDLPGGIHAAVQPNYDDVKTPLADSSEDLELGADSIGHRTVLKLSEKALGLQIVPPAATLRDESSIFTLAEHARNQFRIGEYGTEDPERLRRLEAVIGQVINVPDEELAPENWESEEDREIKKIDDNEGWKTIPDPRKNDEFIEAAPIISQDSDYGTRSFAIVSRREDGSMRKVAFLYKLTERFPKQLLMMPCDPNDNVGSILMSWNGIEAERFLSAAEKLLGIEGTET